MKKTYRSNIPWDSQVVSQMTDDEYWAAVTADDEDRREAALDAAVDLTPEGLQLVIPGAEKLQPAGKAQLELW